MSTIWEQAQGLREEMIARRRNLHQHPETGWTEFRTASMIIKELQALGYEVSFGAAVVNEEYMMGVPSQADLAAYMEMYESKTIPHAFLIKHVKSFEKFHACQTELAGIASTFFPLSAA